MARSRLAEDGDFGLLGELGLDRINARLRVECETSRQIFRDDHSWHRADVEQPFAIENLAHLVVGHCELETEAVIRNASLRGLFAEEERSMRLPPRATFLIATGE